MRHPSGPYIQTFTGKRFYPFAPSVEMIDIRDIAHALAHQCRFSGHTPRFYSVAEHSLHVEQLVTARWNVNETNKSVRELALDALLHDGSETYLVDVPRPIKRSPEFQFYRAVEKKVQGVIHEAFGMWPLTQPAVLQADGDLLRAEAAVFFPNAHTEWETYDKDCKVKLPRVRCFSPKRAEKLFLERFEELTYPCAECGKRIGSGRLCTRCYVEKKL